MVLWSVKPFNATAFVFFSQSTLLTLAGLIDPLKPSRCVRRTDVFSPEYDLAFSDDVTPSEE